MNMYDVWSTANTKSVMAGLYTAAGTRSLIADLRDDSRRLRSVEDPPAVSRLTTPSWMRAPAPSLSR
jgi:hypothetical protein